MGSQHWLLKRETPPRGLVATALKHFVQSQRGNQTMTRIIQSRHRSDNGSLPLFEAAERSRVRALPLAARRLARRHGFASATARMLADAAGFVERGL
jgi:hypothetical protein